VQPYSSSDPCAMDITHPGTRHDASCWVLVFPPVFAFQRASRVLVLTPGLVSVKNARNDMGPHMTQLLRFGKQPYTECVRLTKPAVLASAKEFRDGQRMQGPYGFIVEELSKLARRGLNALPSSGDARCWRYSSS